jgi:hypothetical protein
MTQVYNPDRSNRVTTLALFAENRTFLTSATVAAHRFALGRHRSRSDQPPHADRDQSGVLQEQITNP